MSTEYPGRGKVAILRTSPETVLDDYARVMELAGYREALPKDKETILKINISWQTWYPACSTAPWQLEGVIRALQAAGYENLIGGHNNTVVVNAYVGERNNKQKYVVDKYGLRNAHLYEPEFKWVRYEPKQPFLVLDKIYPEGVHIPEFFYGRNIVQLPTVKTHVFTKITGAMKNAFGGLLGSKRHWTHSRIHQTLVDLLMIQQDVHPGLFAVMDGTFAGDGPGPRAMRWHEKDVILASADQVAIDAMSAQMQGFDPLSIDFIRLAHEAGLGVGDPKQIEVVGEDRDWVMSQDWRFVQEDTFASRGQKTIYHGVLHPIEPLLLRTPLVPWSYFASNLYHNVYWYPFVGRKRVQEALKAKWGRVFHQYGADAGLAGAVMPGMEPRTVIAAAIGLAVAAVTAGAIILALLSG
ncbi:MAG: DUF362 domain-containing protein [Anaerolineales bacterium]|nr:MAG: DUF362 domain-containing protein [Anaerolineales bacterium]